MFNLAVNILLLFFSDDKGWFGLYVFLSSMYAGLQNPLSWAAWK